MGCTAAAAATANVLFAVNPAIGDVTFSAVSDIDTVSAGAGANVGYTTVGEAISAISKEPENASNGYRSGVLLLRNLFNADDFMVTRIVFIYLNFRYGIWK